MIATRHVTFSLRLRRACELSSASGCALLEQSERQSISFQLAREVGSERTRVTTVGSLKTRCEKAWVYPRSKIDARVKLTPVQVKIKNADERFPFHGSCLDYLRLTASVTTFTSAAGEESP